MTRPAARERADHQHAAEQARALPGTWVLAGTYRSRASATAAARQVRTAERAVAYRPAGSFDARTELTADGADLWVRHLDQTARDFRDSLAAGHIEDLAAFSRRLTTAYTARRT
ncbi:hypothetical protein ACIQPQ_34665 [Streptomyces sp. NPDC091281]|uniref:hypothetical protein n=1 Tax=Streptomyces sp. NPDC091281 TaxID=3365985 RepID=UPI003829B054